MRNPINSWMNNQNIHNNLFSILRMGINRPNSLFPNVLDWTNIHTLFEQQGLSAVFLDGIEKIPSSQRPPKELIIEWIGEVLQSYEHRFEMYCRTIAEIAAFYREHNIKMMVLKGYACSQDWPKPEHRPCGDIDVWLFGEQKRADIILSKEKGIRVDTSEHHHTVFYWRDFMVENHYDFLNVYQHKSSAEMESILKKLGEDDSHYTELYGERIYFPSPNLHALFLLKHSMCHFAAESINLRQLLDWAFHVKAHGAEIDWPWLISVVDEYGMRPAFDIFNAICIHDLGFEASLFPEIVYDSDLKERVLNEIINPEFSTVLPKPLIKRVCYKYRRWKASEWKHKLCYNESMWESFWSGIWMHLLKPSQI